MTGEIGSSTVAPDEETTATETLELAEPPGDAASRVARRPGSEVTATRPDTSYSVTRGGARGQARVALRARSRT